MPRGQYDRAAAKAKRIIPGTPAANEPWNEVDGGSYRERFNTMNTEVEDAGDVLEIVQLRAEISKRDDLIARYHKSIATGPIDPAWTLEQVMAYDPKVDRVIPVTQEKYDATYATALRLSEELKVAKHLNTRYAALLKRNGLWLDE